jgi:hypothetical protein
MNRKAVLDEGKLTKIMVLQLKVGLVPQKCF